MFTWICPQCGREVPPAYDECPDCAGKQKTPPAAAPPEPEVKTAPVQAPPPQPAAVQPPPMRPAQPVQQRPVQHSGGVPTWLLSIVFAFAFVGLGAAIYWTVDYFRTKSLTSAAAPVPLEAPSAKKGGKPHPMQRYIEVTGVRFIQDAKKKTEARFLVVNHSPDDISDLGGTVTIWGRTQKSDEEPVGTLNFKVPGIGPWQSREVSTPVSTKLRVYELPDWQNVTAEVQITSP